ncbi:TPA: hypothetical protein ACGO28_000429 [Streptococcus suis]
MVRKTSVNYHPNFISYMEEIIAHPNYRNLPIRFKDDGSPVWGATKTAKKDTTSKKREEWADEKARQLGLEASSKKYANTMFAIHPTKKKACQGCGNTMDLHYIYPTQYTISYFEKNFAYQFDRYDSIYDILHKLPQHETAIQQYLIQKAKLPVEWEQQSIKDVLTEVELLCRTEGKKIFRSGASSHFPERFDGFHSLNLCCRTQKDKLDVKGTTANQHQEQAFYKYWVDGNSCAAKQLMKDYQLFHGQNLQYIGPLNLGFIDDPLNLQATPNNYRAREGQLYQSDIEKLIELEKETQVSPVSYFLKKIWEFIRNDYYAATPLFTLEGYNQILKQNMSNFTESIRILLSTENSASIEQFFSRHYFQPKQETYFPYLYEFHADGSIKSKTAQTLTDALQDEFLHFQQRAFTAAKDSHYALETDGKLPPQLSTYSLHQLSLIREHILLGKNPETTLKQWTDYINYMQDELLIRYLS